MFVLRTTTVCFMKKITLYLIVLSSFFLPTQLLQSVIYIVNEVRIDR